MKKKFASSGVCLLTAIIWGFAFSAQDIASQNAHLIDAFFFNGIRFLLGAVSLIPVIFIFEREKKEPTQELTEAPAPSNKMKATVIYGAILGVILFTASTLQQFAIQLTGESGKIGFITGLYLIFVPIAAFVIFKRKISPLVWGAAVFAICGLYFLSIGNDGFRIQVGDILAFIAVFFWTAHIMFVDKVVNKVSALKLSCIQFFTVGVLDLVIGAFEVIIDSPAGHISVAGLQACIFPILYCGLMSTGVAYTCQIIGQKNTHPAVAALLFSTEGLFAVIAECTFEQKLPSSTMVIGCSLMFIGIILSQIPFSPENRLRLFSKKKKSPEPPKD